MLALNAEERIKMQLFKTLTAIVTLAAVVTVCLSSCLYCAEPISEYEYPEVIYDFDWFSTNSQSGRIEDADAIAAFIDMLNACRFRRVELTARQMGDDFSNEHLGSFVIGETKFAGIGNVDFYIQPELEYLILYDDYFARYEYGAEQTVMYKMCGFDRDVYDALLAKKLIP